MRSLKPMRVLLDQCVDWRLLIDLPLAVIVLVAPTNRLADLRLLWSRLLPAIDQAAAGRVVLVS